MKDDLCEQEPSDFSSSFASKRNWVAMLEIWVREEAKAEVKLKIKLNRREKKPQDIPDSGWREGNGEK